MSQDTSTRPRPVAVSMALAFIGLAGASFCLTCIWLGMRAVMDMGGACGRGFAQDCSDAVAWSLILGTYGGVVALFVYSVGAARLPGPRMALLAWPVLFLSLGFNFWDYGLNPPGEPGPNWTWIACAVLFTVMGGLPLLALRSRDIRREMFWANVIPRDASRPRLLPRVRADPGTGSGAAASPDAGAGPTGGSPPVPRPDEVVDRHARSALDVAAALERVSRLHRDGALSDAEFAAAKERILGGDGAP